MSEAIQEYYDQIVQAVQDGVLPSFDENWRNDQPGNGCMYRHPDGKRRCVVGIRIPDEMYEPSMEGKSVKRLPDDLMQRVIPAGMCRRDLAMLQAHHDFAATYERNTFVRAFLSNINGMDCFNDVIQVDPEEVVRELAACEDRGSLSAAGVPSPV